VCESRPQRVQLPGTDCLPPTNAEDDDDDDRDDDASDECECDEDEADCDERDECDEEEDCDEDDDEGDAVCVWANRGALAPRPGDAASCMPLAVDPA
jgi:hypothetical protein